MKPGPLKSYKYFMTQFEDTYKSFEFEFGPWMLCSQQIKKKFIINKDTVSEYKKIAVVEKFKACAYLHQDNPIGFVSNRKELELGVWVGRK